MSSDWNRKRDIFATFIRVQKKFLDKCGVWGPNVYGILVNMGLNVYGVLVCIGS